MVVNCDVLVLCWEDLVVVLIVVVVNLLYNVVVLVLLYLFVEFLLICVVMVMVQVEVVEWFVVELGSKEYGVFSVKLCFFGWVCCCGMVLLIVFWFILCVYFGLVCID